MKALSLLSFGLLREHIFDVKNWNTDDTGLTDDTSTGSAQIFFCFAKKFGSFWRSTHPAKQENPVFIQFKKLIIGLVNCLNNNEIL
jgi:hypothetical protein